MIAENKRKAERTLLLVLWSTVAGLILIMLFAAWPDYWEHLAGETKPLNWLESVLLVLTAVMAGFIAFIEKWLLEKPLRAFGGWILVALAFAWLAMDERFAIHERVRDRFLKPTGIRLLPWMEAGDWMMPIYMVCGLAAVWGIWRMIGTGRNIRVFFVMGLSLSAIAVGMDTIDVRSLDIRWERLLQTSEEVVETTAMGCFLSAFLCVFTDRLFFLASLSDRRNRKSVESEYKTDMI